MNKPIMAAVNKLNGGPEIFGGWMPDDPTQFYFQGEGRTMGQSAGFIRLKWCNLRCDFCDSKDAWDPTCSLNEGVVSMTTKEIVDLMESFDWHDLEKRVVITGGEPLVQREATLDLLKRFKELGYQTEIEDNAVIIPTDDELKYVDHWNSSPKLASSGNDLSRRNIEALKKLVESGKAIFKFVICSEEDEQEVLELQKLADIPDEMIWLMPEGYDKESQAAHIPMTTKLCEKHGWTLAKRLHIEKFGSRRGV